MESGVSSIEFVAADEEGSLSQSTTAQALRSTQRTREDDSHTVDYGVPLRANAKVLLACATVLPVIPAELCSASSSSSSFYPFSFGRCALTVLKLSSAWE